MAPGVRQSGFTPHPISDRVDPNALASTVLDDLWVIFEATPSHRAIWGPIWGPSSFSGTNMHYYQDVTRIFWRRECQSIPIEPKGNFDLAEPKPTI
jgi:hypothetical protein